MFKVQIAYTYMWTDDSEHHTFDEAQDRVIELLDAGHAPERVQILPPQLG